MVRVLIDFDNTITCWDELIRRTFPYTKPDMNVYDLFERYHDINEHELIDVMCKEGFTTNLKPFPNAIEMIKELSKQHDVYICSAIHKEFIISCNEKVLWVKKYLGEEWVHRIILTFDKTLVQGDILIDDKPVIKGAIEPTWKHICYGSKDFPNWVDKNDIIDYLLPHHQYQANPESNNHSY